MKIFNTVIMMIIFISSIVLSQTKYTVEVSNFVFTPSDLTIDVGDTVHWVNVQGNHNVVADDNSFRNGDPSTDPWTYDLVFTSPGSNPYYCELHGSSGGNGMSGVVTVLTPSDVSNETANVNSYKLMQNFPNPFNPSTKITFNLKESGQVILTVYNLLGKEVTTLVNEKLASGTHSVDFDAATLNSGVYLYTIKSGNFVQTKKMILVK